jgi:hypothetical protein
MTELNKTPSMKESENNSAGNPHRFALIIALTLIGIVAVAGWAVFLYFWHKGDEKAEAFSGLLGFLAAISSSIVTVIFIYITSASLQKAQAGINLQREELEQIKSSVDLQKREWEQKVRVLPQFWIATGGEGLWFKPHSQYPNGPQLEPLSFGKRFILNVWNYSEQSFLVESIRTQRSDLCMVGNFQTREVRLVVKPHSVGEEDISFLVMPLITQTHIPNQAANVLTNDPDNCSKIFVRLTYSDWSQKHARTEVREFELVHRPGDANVSVQELSELSGVNPGI